MLACVHVCQYYSVIKKTHCDKWLVTFSRPCYSFISVIFSGYTCTYEQSVRPSNSHFCDRPNWIEVQWEEADVNIVDDYLVYTWSVYQYYPVHTWSVYQYYLYFCNSHGYGVIQEICYN